MRYCLERKLSLCSVAKLSGSLRRPTISYKKVINVRLSGLLLVVGMLSAIPSASGQGRHSFRIYQDDGMTIAETSGGPKYSEFLFTYEDILRLNEDPTVLESLLYRPGRFTRGPDGGYYVVDRGNHRIAVFDESGRYERSFGSKGGGPGTFRSMSFQCLNDGILHIHDFQLNRTTRMRLDGSLIEVLTRPRLAYRALRYRLTDDRQLLLHREDYYCEKYLLEKTVATIVDAEFDTIATVETDSVVIAVIGASPDSPGRFLTPIQYPGIPCSDYSPSQGILLTNGQTSVINRYNTEGNLVSRIVLDIPPSPVSREERRRIIAKTNRRIREIQEEGKATARLMREFLTIPDVKGWWNQMMIDDAGYIWLAVVGDDSTQAEVGSGALSDVLSPEGEYLGRTRLPANFDSCVIVDGCVCALLYDRETTEYLLTVFQIHSAVEGLKYP